MRKNPTIWIVAALILLVLTLLMRRPLYIAVALGVLAYVGVLLILGRGSEPRRPAPVGPRPTPEEARNVIRAGHARVARMRRLAREIGEERIRTRVAGICALAEQILADLEGDPQEIRVARRFLDYYLEATQTILERYVSLYRRGAENAEAQAVLVRFEALLDTIQSTFIKQHNRILQDDVLDLDTEISVLKQMMDLEGL